MLRGARRRVREGVEASEAGSASGRQASEQWIQAKAFTRERNFLCIFACFLPPSLLRSFARETSKTAAAAPASREQDGGRREAALCASLLSLAPLSLPIPVFHLNVYPMHRPLSLCQLLPPYKDRTRPFIRSPLSFAVSVCLRHPLFFPRVSSPSSRARTVVLVSRSPSPSFLHPRHEAERKISNLHFP